MLKKFLQLDFSHFRGDLFGGITAGIVALPLALAFGAQTELGAIAGLYGAIALGFLAALFGGTAIQISGPTAPMTVVSAVVIASAIDRMGSFEAAFPVILATFFLAGVIELLLGVMGLGKYIKYIPYPVVSGFMSGIGIIIIITQIFPFFGAPSPAGGTVGVVKSLGQIPNIFNIFSVLLAAATIAIIYFFPRITKAVPGSLVALILVSLGAFFFLSNGEVTFIKDANEGGVPTGLPTVYFNFFSVFADTSVLTMILEYAFTLGALGAIDSLLTSVVADNITKTKHNSNRELIGQGLGNMAAAMIGGLPGAGATMRTVINANSGGKTRLSGVIAALLLLAILLGLGVLVGNIPNAVLAGILLTVGISIIDYKGFRHIRKIPRADAAVMIAVLLLTVFVGLLEAVAIGMVMASLLFMKTVSDVVEHRTTSAPIKDFSPEIPWSDETNILEEIGNRVYIKHFDGPLFFGFASRFQEMIKAMPQVEVVVMRMKMVPYVDQSGLYAMEEAILDLQKQGVAVVFSGLQDQPRNMLKRINLVPGLVPESHCFKTFEDCALWLKEYLHKNGSFIPLAEFQIKSNSKLEIKTVPGDYQD
ncbi:MAG: SulP family inorganic anion transporter [Saprospiraceae bacterium]|nr:SulP family inorganic anion transporter [Saprospiraceae bacterium]